MTAHFTTPKDPMQAGRLRKALARQYRFSDGKVRSLGAHIIDHSLTRRSHYIRHYALKKRGGCNARLAAPKHEYTVWWLDKKWGELGTDVPKIVFDALETLPASEGEEYHSLYGGGQIA